MTKIYHYMDHKLDISKNHALIMPSQTNDDKQLEERTLDLYLGRVKKAQEKRKQLHEEIVFPEIESMTNSELISQVKTIGADKWLALSKWTADHKYFEPQDRQLFYWVGVWVGQGKGVNPRNAKFCLICYNKALNAGFDKIIEDM